MDEIREMLLQIIKEQREKIKYDEDFIKYQNDTILELRERLKKYEDNKQA